MKTFKQFILEVEDEGDIYAPGDKEEMARMDSHPLAGEGEALTRKAMNPHFGCLFRGCSEAESDDKYYEWQDDKHWGGTPDGTPHVFERGTYFTSDPHEAKSYAEHSHGTVVDYPSDDEDDPKPPEEYNNLPHKFIEVLHDTSKAKPLTTPGHFHVGESPRNPDSGRHIVEHDRIFHPIVHKNSSGKPIGKTVFVHIVAHHKG